jgi:hypothetical protein
LLSNWRQIEESRRLSEHYTTGTGPCMIEAAIADLPESAE